MMVQVLPLLTVLGKSTGIANGVVVLLQLWAMKHDPQNSIKPTWILLGKGKKGRDGCWPRWNRDGRGRRKMGEKGEEREKEGKKKGQTGGRLLLKRESLHMQTESLVATGPFEPSKYQPECQCAYPANCQEAGSA